MKQNHSVDLLGKVIPDPQELPRDKQLGDWSDLVGHTVRWVFEQSGDLKNQAQAVITTETGCFLALAHDGDDLYPINSNRELRDFVTGKALARTGFLGSKTLAEQELQDKKDRIAELRKAAQENLKSAGESAERAGRYDAQAAELEAEIAAAVAANQAKEG